ncbi:MAG: flagellar biosynthesis protein FlhA [Deltaproteobacteria bacterium]|nr:flagellar biosynthesis protein FlhA [Deltaproteobacteria bacterium]
MAVEIEKNLPRNIVEMAVPIGIMAILAVMIIPVPTLILDLLLSMNITLAVIILLIAANVMKPLDFAVFPTILLVTTLFRLSLNVASTRLILLHGSEGPQAAGQVIKSFGMFVVGGNYAVGMVVFIILVIINFVVITKGAGRIAEVSARFTLDAMPGKQMSIDADLNAGLIREDEARKRRREIAREADFYGTMDGASKFVRGDAVAGILITFINIIGGIIIGVVQQGMDITDAFSVYTILTIGDGLVAQIPALVISTAAGIIVTRAASETGMGREFASQFLLYPKAIYGAAGVLFVLGLVPGLPHIAFLTLSSITGGLAYLSGQGAAAQVIKEKEEEIKGIPIIPERDEIIPPDPLAVEVGYRLIPLVDAESGGELPDRIKAMRRQIANDTGFLVPPIHIKDNLQLKPEEYTFLLRGIEIGRSSVMMNHYMAIDPGNAQKGLEGIPTKEPAFGLPALWTEESLKDKAKVMGWTVVNPTIVIITHITEVIKANAYKLITRQDVQGILDTLAKTHPKVVEELVPSQLSLGGVEKVLKNLLRERIPIRDALTIIETLADYAPLTKDADILTEYVRQALSNTITRQYAAEDGLLPVMMLDPRVEEYISKSVQQSQQGAAPGIEPSLIHSLISKVTEGMRDMTYKGYQPILLTSAETRRFIKRLIERSLPSVVVLGSSEISGDVRIKNLKVVSLEDAYQKV